MKFLVDRCAGGRIAAWLRDQFGELIYVQRQPHAGLVRLPDVRSPSRIALMEQVLARHPTELERRAIITVRGQRIRVSLPQDDLGSTRP